MTAVDAARTEGLRVDDLARAAGTTVRNVRAYQDRGLLTAPRRVGRVAWYDAGHLSRLRLIASLLDRGFSLGNIAELIAGWDSGQGLGDLIGLGQELASPFSDEVADVGTAEEIAARYALPDGTDPALAHAIELGLVEVDGDQLRVPSPRTLRAGVELAEAGVPVDELFAEVARLRTDVEAIAERLVQMVVRHVIEPRLDDDGVPLPGEAVELAAAVHRVRPLATTVVTAELARALQARADAELGDRLARILA